ncbi:MAG: hypothetical protein SH848_19935 [Saprospiraceae bacterium]|nr:hypothetical protein [Saprospiraceae bacterium]MDZ4706209.1 hypothetical protein [Saprospiraceae bacterium]
MKNVGMTLFFFFSVAMIQLSAQSCQPSPNCPPGCVKACTPDGKSAAVNNKTTDVAALVAACTPAQLEACKTSTPSAACCSKSGKSAALTTTAKATTVSNTAEGATTKKMCTQPCTKPASALEQ